MPWSGNRDFANLYSIGSFISGTLDNGRITGGNRFNTTGNKHFSLFKILSGITFMALVPDMLTPLL